MHTLPGAWQISMVGKIMGKVAGPADGTYEARYDAIMEQFGTDMCIYMRMVCDTIVTTVPKSVVHCLVRKAEKNLLNHMFTYVHKLPDVELKQLLQVRGRPPRRGGGGARAGSAVQRWPRGWPIGGGGLWHRHLLPPFFPHQSPHPGRRFRRAKGEAG
jgi:hypothetical protein